MQDITCFQRLSNGSIDPDSEVTRVIDLQETLEKQNSDITTARQKLQVRLPGIMELTPKWVERYVHVICTYIFRTNWAWEFMFKK